MSTGQHTSTYMIRHSIQLARHKGRHPVREPSLANLVIAAGVEELRELVATSSARCEGDFSDARSAELSSDNSPTADVDLAV